MEETPILMSAKFRPSDKVSNTFESLDYDPIHSFIYVKEIKAWTVRQFQWLQVEQWVVTFLIGMTTGLIAFGIDMGVKYLNQVKYNFTWSLLEQFDYSFWVPSITYVSMCVGLVVVAAFMVAFLEPVAAGSGIPEIKCYLNGIKIPHVTRFKTLLCKAGGVMFSVAAGCAVGKEGPMIHSGAVVAAGLSQGKAESLRCDTGLFRGFRNDEAKRDFVSGGAAAGVAAAFGAPIGGVLFSLEEGASFWSQQLNARTLFCSMVSTFTLNFFLSGTTTGGQWGQLSEPGLISFGSFSDQALPGYNVFQVPFFLLIGVFGGLIGALFNWINEHLTVARMKHIPIERPFRRFAEVIVVTAVTAILCITISIYATQCVKIDQDDVTNKMDLSSWQLQCPDNDFSDMAAIFLTDQETAIKNLFHAKSEFTYRTLVLFFCTYFLLATWTYGIAVPSGLFVPCLLMGCTMGRLFGQLCAYLLPSIDIDPGTFALIGAAAVLGGVVRMTISLTVILMESTNDITYGLPIMLTLMVAKWVGDMFNEGLYDIHIDLRKIPLLGWEPPRHMRKFTAADVMSQPVVILPELVSVSDVIEVLSKTPHNGFPVVDVNSHMLGLILRSQLITLLIKKAFRAPGDDVLSDASFYQTAKIGDFLENYPQVPKLEDVSVSETERGMHVDLTPFMNPSPFTVQPNALLLRVFRLFRTMGLRHLPVVDSSNRIVGIITRKELVHLEERFERRSLPTSIQAY